MSTTIMQQVLDKLQGYEHSGLLTCGIDSNAGNFIDVLFDDLATVKPHGNVISTYRDEEKKLHFIVEKEISHEAIVASTGGGKTTGPMAAQLIKELKVAENSLVVIDSKGELYSAYSEAFRKAGYKVQLLNFKSAEHSEGWNPFECSAKDYRDKMLELNSALRGAGRRKYPTTFNGITFNDKSELVTYVNKQKKRVEKVRDSAFKDIITKVFVINEQQRDPYWDFSANKLLSCIAASLSNLTIQGKGITVDQVNFCNICKIFYGMQLGHRTLQDRTLQDYGVLSREGDMYSQVKYDVFENAEQTMRNILSFVGKKCAQIDTDITINITKTSSVSPEDLVNERTILFVTYDEMNVLDRQFLSYFISTYLSKLKNIAERYDDIMLPRKVLFQIDEFATFPKNTAIRDFFSTGRSRGIFIHFCIQSYSQLRSIYGDASEQILDSVNDTIFLGTNHHETMARFSKELGMNTVISATSILNDEKLTSVEQLPLVTVSDLAFNMQLGDCFVKRRSNLPLKGFFELSFKCAEYACRRTRPDEYTSNLDLLDEKYEFDYDKWKAEWEKKQEEDRDFFESCPPPRKMKCKMSVSTYYPNVYEECVLACLKSGMAGVAEIQLSHAEALMYQDKMLEDGFIKPSKRIPGHGVGYEVTITEEQFKKRFDHRRKPHTDKEFWDNQIGTCYRREFIPDEDEGNDDEDEIGEVSDDVSQDSEPEADESRDEAEKEVIHIPTEVTTEDDEVYDTEPPKPIKVSKSPPILIDPKDAYAECVYNAMTFGVIDEAFIRMNVPVGHAQAIKILERMQNDGYIKPYRKKGGHIVYKSIITEEQFRERFCHEDKPSTEKEFRDNQIGTCYRREFIPDDEDEKCETPDIVQENEQIKIPEGAQNRGMSTHSGDDIICLYPESIMNEIYNDGFNVDEAIQKAYAAIHSGVAKVIEESMQEDFTQRRGQWDSESQFEDTVMDGLEHLISEHKEFVSRNQAIDYAAKQLVVVRLYDQPIRAIDVHKRMLNEFVTATDEEYNILYKMIFSDQ